MLRAALSRLRVNELRVLLTQAGLGTDGEKETLVERLYSYGRGFGFQETHQLYEHLHAQEVPLQPANSDKPVNTLHMVTTTRSTRRLVVWEIQRYSALTQGPGEALRSPRFMVASEWELSLFPAGLSAQSRHYSALMLNSLRTADAGESVRFKAAVVGPPPACERFEVQSIVELIQPKETRGFSKFLETREMKQYLNADDTLRLECEVEEFTSWRSGVRLSSSSVPETSDASDAFESLLPGSTSGGFDSFADVELECEGTRLSAHRCVLAARSPVFAAMLRCDMREARERVVHLRDIRLPVLRIMLRYMYTGRCNIQLPSFPVANQSTSAATSTAPSAQTGNDASALDQAAQLAAEVLAAADMYELSGLKCACERLLGDALAMCPLASLAVLHLADIHALPHLRALALECVVAHAPVLLTSPAFGELCHTAPGLVLDINRALLLAGGVPTALANTPAITSPLPLPPPKTLTLPSTILPAPASPVPWVAPITIKPVQPLPDRRPGAKRRRASMSH